MTPHCGRGGLGPKLDPPGLLRGPSRVYTFLPLPADGRFGVDDCGYDESPQRPRDDGAAHDPYRDGNELRAGRALPRGTYDTSASSNVPSE